jgi:hypothetical protein
LIEKYLTYFFKDAKSIKPFDKYLEESYLNRLFYTTKLLKGDVIQDIEKTLGASTVDSLNA